MDPGQEVVHEGFREAFGPAQALEEEAAEDFHDRGGIGIGKRQELSVAIENAVAHEGMGKMGSPEGCCDRFPPDVN
jgi:hypothetical protein